MRLTCVHFKLADFVRPGESYHFARTGLTADNAARYHDHDYHEVFWVTHGRGEHFLNGQTAPLQAGQLHLIRPQDRHRVTGSAQAPLRLANLAFPSRAWTEVRRRYFHGDRDWFGQPAVQRVWLVDAKAQAGLAHWAERLATPERPRIETRIELDPAVGTISADADQIARALRNLILNAMDAMPEGGTLSIRTARVGAIVRLEVSDTGQGLTPEECARLFTPYYTTKQHGTGLGLAIVQSVVTDHKGRVAVDSKPGQGATFRIELDA